MAQTVNNLSSMWETQIRSLGQEDLMEEGMATNSTILASRISWTEEPWPPPPHWITNSQTRLSNQHIHTYIYYLSEVKNKVLLGCRKW